MGNVSLVNRSPITPWVPVSLSSGNFSLFVIWGCAQQGRRPHGLSCDCLAGGPQAQGLLQEWTRALRKEPGALSSELFH